MQPNAIAATKDRERRPCPVIEEHDEPRAQTLGRIDAWLNRGGER
jgi:hypothetical protein